MMMTWSTLCSLLLPLAAAWSPQDPRSYSDYWDRGQAEIARYQLTQSRYGEPREGHAVLVFVAEDFRTDRQVKNERGGHDVPSARILKLNRIQRFTTGIYDYSMMQSVFSPVDRATHPRAFKTTTSIQDWCGHVWAQLNRTDEGYRFAGHSYFESEGEQDRALADALLEDELFTLVRIDPSSLPVGDVRLIPGMFDARLRHLPVSVQTAKGELVAGPESGQQTYRVRYRDGRTLEIVFEAALPHGILSFREAIGDQVTEAVRTHVRQSAYWQENGRRFDRVRDAIGLEPGDIGRG